MRENLLLVTDTPVQVSGENFSWLFNCEHFLFSGFRKSVSC